MFATNSQWWACGSYLHINVHVTADELVYTVSTHTSFSLTGTTSTSRVPRLGMLSSQNPFFLTQNRKFLSPDEGSFRNFTTLFRMPGGKHCCFCVCWRRNTRIETLRIRSLCRPSADPQTVTSYNSTRTHGMVLILDAHASVHSMCLRKRSRAIGNRL